jgi:hypothetical protein
MLLMLRRLSFLLPFLLCPFTVLLAQQETFKGVVVDSTTFAALPFVNVRVKNSMRGTSTDMQGNFAINATRRDTLILSLVGYQTFEQPLWDWEPSVIRMRDKSILLNTVTVQSQRMDPYEGLFDEQNEKIDRRRVPFYLSRTKKQKRKLVWLREDNARAQTYVDVVINTPETKSGLMQKYGLTETAYYDLLADFNTRNVKVMYYLTAPELMSLLNNFFESNAPLPVHK